MDESANATRGSEGWPLYRGTKQLRAICTDKASYCKLRGWPVPDGEDPAERGYIVEYQNGGAPNVDGFEGYVSWSPADVFERIYRHIDFEQPHIVRIEEELADLKARLDRLTEFMGGATYAGLSARKQTLLAEQRHHMEAYLELLNERLLIEREEERPVPEDTVAEATDGFVTSEPRVTIGQPVDLESQFDEASKQR